MLYYIRVYFSVLQLDAPGWTGRDCRWLEVCRLGGAMHGILCDLEGWYHWLLHNICIAMKLRLLTNISMKLDCILSHCNVQHVHVSILFSLKMPGFLASMVCSNSGASPSGSSLPRLSFSSLKNIQVQSHYFIL